MWLTRLSVDRPIFITTVLAALFLFGAYGYGHMPKELNPRVQLPILNVTAVYTGGGPQQVEDRVTRPLEDAVATLPGIKQTDSVSMEGLASITVSLQEGVNPNIAISDVRSRVEAARAGPGAGAGGEPVHHARSDRRRAGLSVSGRGDVDGGRGAGRRRWARSRSGAAARASPL